MQTKTHQSRHLARSTEGYVAGVCEGLARHFGVNANLLRIIWVVAVLGFGTGLLLYAILWWLMPRADRLPLEPTVWLRDADGTRHPPLARTTVDRRLFGVCGGFARRWNLDPTLVRLGALTLVTVSFGLALVAYFIAAIVIPTSGHPLEKPHPVEL